ncbi:uncharacterized protein LOC143556546 [Bidens hawaiensis]|uniref:uncharacterized protein LOC143556546 n=1 Tax=Bidens hawaiensis TaxID=980011 RepID=UPI0040496720
MEFGNQASYDKASSTSMQHLGFLDRLHTKAQNQPENKLDDTIVADLDVDLREIYFLVMHFLSAGPCQRTFSQFCNELMEYRLLPKRYHAWYSRNGEVSGDENDDGISFPLSYEGVAQRYSHIEKDHLVQLLKQLILHVAPSRGIFGKTPPTAADVPTLLGTGTFSLLGGAKNEAGSNVKPLPSYLRWPHMQADQVRGIGLREIGGGFPKHHRAPSIRFASYAIAKPSTMVQKMQNIKKLRGHRDAVYCAIFDRTGRYVITGSDDRLVKIWSMETAFCLASCRGHEGDITDLAVNLNNTLVASASNDYNIRVWRMPDGMPISVLRGHTGAVTAIAFSPRHNSVFQILSSSDDGTCRIWDARYTQGCARVYVPRRTDDVAGSNSGPSSSTSNPQNNQILCCAYNANGTIFVTGSSDTFARVWSACKPNIDDSQQPVHEIDVLAGHENDVNYVQFSGCAVASRSLTLDTSTDEKVPKLKTLWYSHDNIVTCSRDGSAIIWILKSRKSHGKVGRWTRAYHLKVPPPPMPPQPRRGGPRQRFLPTPRGVNMIVWSLDNRFVLAAIMDCRICVWNASDGRLVHSLTGHSESTYVLDVHPFNPRIAMSSGYDGKTIIWDIWEGIPIRVYEIGRFKLVDGKFSPDGTSVVLSDDVGQIYLLNTGQGESQKDAKYDQFFLGDYRPLGRDAHGHAIDEETQLAPYRRNIQDALCDSSMLPYPEPYQSNYQRRRLGALKLEWRPPSLKFAIGTDIGLGQEYQMLPLADLDVVVEPLPEFLDAMFWEPENDIIIDSTDSEYNVTDDSEDEQASLSNNSGDAVDSSGGNNIDDGSSRRRSKRKKPKDVEWTSSSGRRVKRKNTNEHEGTSSRNKRSKKSKNNRNPKVSLSRPQRVSTRNGKKISSQAFEDDEEYDDDVYSSESETEPDIEEEEEEEKEEQEKEQEEKPKVSIPPPESKLKLVVKFSLSKKLPIPQNTPITLSQSNEPSSSSKVEEEISKPSESHKTTKPTIIRIKQVKKEEDVKPTGGECSQVKNEDIGPQKRKTIKLKFKSQSTKEKDSLTEVDSMKFQSGSRETNDAPQNHKNQLHLISSGGSMASGSGSKSNGQISKTNWLLLSGQEGRCRYIPQLGDEVAYLRQGHQEYIISGNSLGREPWKLFKEKIIRDVEICSVEDLDYTTLAGSGESGCKLKLKFIDPSSNVYGQIFALTLPELDFPDFLVERTRYENSLERNWNVGEKCTVWWRDEGGGGGGSLWAGSVESISDKSVDFPGSQWERFLVKYADGTLDPIRHSPWELLDKDSEWEQPRIDPDIRKMMLSLLSKLEHTARGNQDKYGIMKLKQTSERLDFINRFPVPLTLEIIELRLKNFYYRSFDAMKHDISVMLANVRTYFAKHTEMLGKMTRLSEWFDRKLSEL